MKRLLFILLMASVGLTQNILILQAAEDLTNENDFINLIEVKKVDINFIGKDREEIYKALLDNFMINPQETKFDKLTTENWLSKFESFKAALVNKATQKGFDGKSLEKCLALIIKVKGFASLPVGAYLAKLGEDNVWVIVDRWEFIPKDNRPMSLGHISAHAFRADNQEEIGFASCK